VVGGGVVGGGVVGGGVVGGGVVGGGVVGGNVVGGGVVGTQIPTTISQSSYGSRSGWAHGQSVGQVSLVADPQPVAPGRDGHRQPPVSQFGSPVVVGPAVVVVPP